MDMYNNSSTQEKIFNFQKTNDLKVLISTIRLTTTISKNSINVSIILLYFLYIYLDLFVSSFLLFSFYYHKNSI